jgi:hypothetical protein
MKKIFMRDFFVMYLYFLQSFKHLYDLWCLSSPPTCIVRVTVDWCKQNEIQITALADLTYQISIRMIKCFWRLYTWICTTVILYVTFHHFGPKYEICAIKCTTFDWHYHYKLNLLYCPRETWWPCFNFYCLGMGDFKSLATMALVARFYLW